MDDFLLSVLAGIVGGLITGGLFFWRGGKQLRDEAARLRRLHELTLRGLEEVGEIEYRRNDRGEVTGLYIDLHAVSVGRGLGHAILDDASKDNAAK